MTKYADIAATGSVENVQNTLQKGFEAVGFRVGWQNATKGMAEKGTRGKNTALGALAQYYAIDFEIYPQPNGATLRLHKANLGAPASIVGVALVNREFNNLADTIAS